MKLYRNYFAVNSSAEFKTVTVGADRILTTNVITLNINQFILWLPFSRLKLMIRCANTLQVLFQMRLLHLFFEVVLSKFLLRECFLESRTLILAITIAKLNECSKEYLTEIKQASTDTLHDSYQINALSGLSGLSVTHCYLD